MRLFRSRGLQSIGRRCFGHYGAMTTAEMQEILLARGMKNAPENPSRTQLEALLDRDDLAGADREALPAQEYEAAQSLGKAGLERADFVPATRRIEFATQTLSFDDRGFDVLAEGRFGVIGSNSSIDWAEMGGRVNVNVNVSETSEAYGSIPSTFRRRDTGVGNGPANLQITIEGVIQACMETAHFPHSFRVHSHLVWHADGGGSSPLSHILAACQSLRMKGLPICAVGGARIGISSDGTVLLDPGPRAAALADCLVSLVVKPDGEIVFAEIEGRFSSEEKIQMGLKAALEHASQMAESLAELELPYRTIVKSVVSVSVPPDFQILGPTAKLLREVRQTVGEVVDEFARGPWRGEAAAQAVAMKCEELCHRTIRERASVRDLRAAVFQIMIQSVAEAKRASGVGLAEIESVGGAVTVSHGVESGLRGVVYCAVEPAVSSTQPEACLAPSLWNKQKNWRGGFNTTHGEYDSESNFLSNVSRHARNARLSMAAHYLSQSLFSDAYDREGRVVIQASSEGVAWDLALTVAVSKQLRDVKPISAPTVSVWSDGSVSVRPDPMQMIASKANVIVAATDEGKVTFVRALANPQSSLSVNELLAAVSAGVISAKNELALLPVQKSIPATTVPLSKGLRHRLQNRVYLGLLATSLSSEFRLVEQGLEMRPAVVLEGQLSWEDCPAEGWYAEVDQKAPYGFFCTALDPETEVPLTGLTGLVHFTRGAAGGGRLGTPELEALPLKSRVKVRFVEWNNGDKPVLERV